MEQNQATTRRRRNRGVKGRAFIQITGARPGGTVRQQVRDPPGELRRGVHNPERLLCRVDRTVRKLDFGVVGGRRAQREHRRRETDK